VRCDIEGRGDGGVAANEDDAGGVDRTESAEARPAGIESEIGADQQPRHPVADEKPEHHPDHRKQDADLARIVVVAIEAVLRRLGIEQPRDNAEQAGNGSEQYDGALHAERIVVAGRRHCEADQGQSGKDDERDLPLGLGELSDHRAPSLHAPDRCRLR
jgi:hypothetical protein